MTLKRLGSLLLDLALALLAIGAAVALYRLGVMPLLELLLPPNESLVTAVRRVGVVSSAFVAYWAVARLHERRRLGELVFKPLPTALGALSGSRAKPCRSHPVKPLQSGSRRAVAPRPRRARSGSRLRFVSSSGDSFPSYRSKREALPKSITRRRVNVQGADSIHLPGWASAFGCGGRPPRSLL